MNDEPSVSVKPVRRWFTRKRFLIPLAMGILLLVTIFFAVPLTPLHVCVETCGIAGPLTSEGKPDYDAVLTTMTDDFLRENADRPNGFVPLLAALGPKFIGGDTWEADWNQYLNARHDEDRDKFFHRQWVPMCERWRISPQAEPKFYGVGYDLYALRDYITEHGITEQEPIEPETSEETLEETSSETPPQTVVANGSGYVAPGNRLSYEEARQHVSTLMTFAWSASENPVAAAWLDEREPLWTLLLESMRADVFVCPPIPANDNVKTYAVPLENHAMDETTALIRCLQLRANRRIAEKRYAEVLAELPILCHWTRVMQRVPDPEIRAICTECDSVVCDVVSALLQDDGLSDAQLESLQELLTSLPAYPPLDERNWRFYELRTYQYLYKRANPWRPQKFRDWCVFDGNTLGREASRWLEQERTFALKSNRQERYQDYLAWVTRWDAESPEHWIGANDSRVWEMWIYSRYILSVDIRSKAFANLMLNSWDVYGMGGGTPLVCLSHLIDQQESEIRLAVIAVALERYRRTHGSYPETLATLVEVGLLSEIPVDPSTGKTNFQYIAQPYTSPESYFRCSKTSPYTLYSVAFDQLDNTRNPQSPAKIREELVCKEPDARYLQRDVFFQRDQMSRKTVP